MAPSRRLYCVCKCRCVNSAMRAQQVGPSHPRDPGHKTPQSVHSAGAGCKMPPMLWSRRPIAVHAVVGLATACALATSCAGRDQAPRPDTGRVLHAESLTTHIRPGQTKPVEFVLRTPDGAPVAGETVTFTIVD